MNNEVENVSKVNVKSVGLVAAGLGLVTTIGLVIYKKFFKKNEEVAEEATIEEDK